MRGGGAHPAKSNIDTTHCRPLHTGRWGGGSDKNSEGERVKGGVIKSGKGV